jgi:hypothetical protein
LSAGPTILWGQLKGKRVKSNDGKDLGKIDKISQNYIRLEKGRVKKEKFWVPKYFADSFDGKILWLLATQEELRSQFHFGKEPPPARFRQDFNAFKTSYDGTKRWVFEKVGITNERIVGVSSKAKSSSGYKNIRELK